jgi:hypothetical protein
MRHVDIAVFGFIVFWAIAVLGAASLLGGLR